MFFGSVYGWWLEENFDANPDSQNADTIMLGAQLGAKFSLFGGETRVAAHYYDLGGGRAATRSTTQLERQLDGRRDDNGTTRRSFCTTTTC
jgi:hypothetical protein